MTTKFTPGPWVACADYRMVWGHKGSTPVVDSSVGIHSTPDAHLIAAAPELYEALQRMVEVYKDMEDENGEPCPDVIAARAALAKARGEIQ